MKSRIKEQGSATHIIIIVVLILAVLGLLGFVFWQNFMNKPSTSTSQSQSTTEDQTTPTDSTETLDIAEWGLSGEYASTKGTKVTYTIEDNSITLSTPGLPEYCQDGTSIKRYDASDEINVPGADPQIASELYASLLASTSPTSLRMSFVEDKYFYYVGPQELCDADEDSVQQIAHDFTVDAAQSVLRTLAPLE